MIYLINSETLFAQNFTMTTKPSERRRVRIMTLLFDAKKEKNIFTNKAFELFTYKAYNKTLLCLLIFHILVTSSLIQYTQYNIHYIYLIIYINTKPCNTREMKDLFKQQLSTRLGNQLY